MKNKSIRKERQSGETLEDNIEEINYCIKVIPKDKINSKGNGAIRLSNLDMNRSNNGNYYNQNNNVENINDFETECRNYIEDILKIDEYVKLPNSINNEQDKIKWKKAHSLRNRMKEYDLITRTRLYQSNSVNNKAKLNRERYIILNKIPRYREAFPSIMNNTSTDKIKEDIIRTYLKTHAAYFLSQNKKNSNLSLKNMGRNTHFSFRKKSDDRNNSLINYNKHMNDKSKSVEHNNCPNLKKKDRSYNLWKRITVDDIKNTHFTPTEKQYLKDYNIFLNDAFNNFKINQNNNKRQLNVKNQKNIPNYDMINNKIYGHIKNNANNNLYINNQKREDAYIINPSQNNIITSPNEEQYPYFNNYSYSDKNKNLSTYNTEGKRNIYTNDVKSNTNYQHSNNSNYSDESLNMFSNSSTSIYEKYNLKDKNFVLKRDRYALLGKIKNNKEIEVKLVLNKV